MDHSEAWDRLQRAFRAEFPFVKRIVFPADPGGSRISFALEDTRFPGRRIYASEMSDGMIVYLCLLSMIVHPNQIAVLALDEPDAHLHPSAVRRLLGLAHEQHGRRHLLIVTHSNALLDELRDPAASVRIFEPTKEGARVRELDAEALKAWRSEYTLSEMRRTGLLDPPNSAYGDDE
jgi:predicted ATPase